MPNYTLIAGLLLYFLVVNMSASLRIKPLTASLIVVLSYFAVSSFIQGIILIAYDAPLWQLFGVAPLATVALQGIIALFVFHKLDNSDDSYVAWLLWGMLGAVGIFYIAPAIGTNLFAGL
ncbi:MAG: hypothetical protein UY35_C0019G0009 [Candidatus Saccharibacteria bacterium GW2011_GWC2_48_9]|nr:MAG: hypothetical protein UY35_C0019G0009 [Candidatus Saccharibacteria bacterium GW2011_GWC2_48_9]HCH33964.1 hypothetical protein [Candidatus Saccharibacteria bacterium]